MKARRALCLILAALCALQPVAPALADGTATTLAPAQIDQLMAERYGPLSYQPQADGDALATTTIGAGAPLLAAASAGDGGSSSTQVWVIVGIVVVLALVLGGGGGGGSY
jgi:cobalamin biosynthesis Mg chelatase CobN